MDISLIGNQITKYRKAQSMTQEELGRAVGVSTQAVSRWENGGAPDVGLLPAIADKLGVPINALFGRESVQIPDMSSALISHLRSLPEGTRLSALVRLIWDIMPSLDPRFNSLKVDYSEHAITDLTGESNLFRSFCGFDEGFIMGVGAEDMSFMSVFPEPESGFETFLEDNDTYRKLYSALAMPGSLELIRFFLREAAVLYSPAAAAKGAGITLEDAEKSLDAMAEARIIHRHEVILDVGPTSVYIVPDPECFVPFFYLSTWLRSKVNMVRLSSRKSPPFRKKELKNEKHQKA